MAFEVALLPFKRAVSVISWAVLLEEDSAAAGAARGDSDQRSPRCCLAALTSAQS